MADPERHKPRPSIPFSRHPSLKFNRRGSTWSCTHLDKAWPVTLYARDIYYGTQRLLAVLTLDRQEPGMPNPIRLLTGAADLLVATQRKRFAEEAAIRMARAVGEQKADVSTTTAITTMVDALLEQLSETRYDIDIVSLADVEVPADMTPQYAVWPIVPRSRPGLLIAPSGSGKSTLAGGIALSVVTGIDIVPGITARDHGVVIYIGQEEDAAQMRARVETMRRGHKLEQRDIRDFHYMKLRGGNLIDSSEMIAELAADLGAKLIVVDSAQATWGGNEDGNVREYASRWFGAIELLECPTLVIDHPNLQGTKKNSGELMAAGSSVKRDRAGHVWTVRSIEVPVRDGMPFKYHVTLTDAKRNYVGRQPNIDYEMLSYRHEWSKFVEAGELDAAAVVDASRTFAAIASIMREPDEQHMDGWTSAELADRLEAKDDRRIRAELNLEMWRPAPWSEEEEVTIVQVDGTGSGKGNPGRFVIQKRRLSAQMTLVPGMVS